MYRHFNIRICDIVDTAAIADAGLIDYEELSILAESAGIWEGVATYLAIISDYVRTYRGTALSTYRTSCSMQRGFVAPRFTTNRDFCEFHSCRTPRGSMDPNWRMY